MAEDVVAHAFGDRVRGPKSFWFRETEIECILVPVAWSGWSRQGVFEICLQDGSKGTQLWNILLDGGVGAAGVSVEPDPGGRGEGWRPCKLHLSLPDSEDYQLCPFRAVLQCWGQVGGACER
ncbi:MAG: hypothetical protein NTX73_03145 [Rhodobacterales bacterium]|nr:hypothetical protein [Rhodobacterales bacterium]